MEKVRLCCFYLRNSGVIGFDTETRPSFKRRVNKVALLRLSTDDKAFLFRLNHFFELPVEVTRLFSDPGIIKAGVAIRDDIKLLQNKRKFKPEGFVELQDIC